VDAVGVVAKPQLKTHDKNKSDSSEAIKGRREIFFTGSVRKFIDTPVYDYARLGTGNEIAGPAVIELPFTTILVPPGSRVIIDDYLNLLMEIL
jgi:N-methylhydantoinase A